MYLRDRLIKERIEAIQALLDRYFNGEVIEPDFLAHDLQWCVYVLESLVEEDEHESNAV